MNKRELKQSISRLTKLATVVMAVPNKLWNMDTFGKPRCGTACCVLGHAAHVPEFKAKGLKWRKCKWKGFYDTSENYITFKGARSEHAGAGFFGLTDKEADRLFMSGFDASPAAKARQIATLVRKRVAQLEKL
jgi:hypothetical protein